MDQLNLKIYLSNEKALFFLVGKYFCNSSSAF